TRLRPTTAVVASADRQEQRELAAHRHELAVSVPELTVLLEEPVAHHAGAEPGAQPPGDWMGPDVDGELERRYPRRGDDVEDRRWKRVGEEEEGQGVGWPAIGEADPAGDLGGSGPLAGRPARTRTEPEVEPREDLGTRGHALGWIEVLETGAVVR